MSCGAGSDVYSREAAVSCGAGSDVYSRCGCELRGGQRHAAEVLLVSCGAGGSAVSRARSDV